MGENRNETKNLVGAFGFGLILKNRKTEFDNRRESGHKSKSKND